MTFPSNLFPFPFLLCQIQIIIEKKTAQLKQSSRIQNVPKHLTNRASEK